MITKTQKEQMKAVFGAHYASLVQVELVASGVLSTSGKTHTKHMIRQVFNGEREHLPIEEAIFKAFAKKKKELKRIKKKRESILKS